MNIVPKEKELGVASEKLNAMGYRGYSEGWNECRKQTLKNLASEEVVSKVEDIIDEYVCERCHQMVKAMARAIVDELRK